jgi:hypothetical protein
VKPEDHPAKKKPFERVITDERAKKELNTRIRPYEGDTELADQIAEETGLSRIDVMSLSLHAGLAAIKENNLTFSVPLIFDVRKDDPMFKRLEKTVEELKMRVRQIEEESRPQKKRIA